GQKVKRGDVLLLLEAMKMENEIVAPQDGTVVALRVPASAAVNTGDPLVDLA
ncbi:MAG TPA: acetyl-CoA carboxylase biotin carboxyl carrier protein subunit, partial [Rectinema sp.]|nr:acetyl-CoA carboxylase biotin carboxyl carrier protein subunit [Spirochaetaceae bacterium]HOR48828.1 acetyl-CoA carboxylase biotin carboxyl carrier protein subunit [Rectinema sp.]HPN03663.1 acetyl-CoA carboxylase biotin carboxyl carrier protein subunit [Rectinema sp.]HQB08025.1 acetyl-CoA carboxylase biotin carboxyl carrier protein subunit [Rectinema sp.]HQQ72243.1 acetyl-CoA carboxylase biotin carboxyl carrier protein subunit [Rectinema sp.]